MAKGGSVPVSVQYCVCPCVPRAGLCTCAVGGVGRRGAGRTASTRMGPPRVKRRPASGSSPPGPRGRADALTRPTAPWAHRRVPGGRSDRRPADAQRVPQAVAAQRLPSRRGARSTRLPRCGRHSACCCSSPTQWTCSPCTEGRSKVQMWPGWWWVGTTRQTRGSPVGMGICLVPDAWTQGQHGELSSNLDLESTSRKGLEVGLTGPSLPAASQE